MGSKQLFSGLANNSFPDPWGFGGTGCHLSAQFPRIKFRQKWDIVIENQPICESENYLKALKTQSINQFWHIVFCWLCSHWTWCWSEAHFIKSYFINKDQTRICLIASLGRSKALQGYSGWRFLTTVFHTGEIRQINRHCPGMHFASSLKK